MKLTDTPGFKRRAVRRFNTSLFKAIFENPVARKAWIESRAAAMKNELCPHKLAMEAHERAYILNKFGGKTPAGGVVGTKYTTVLIDEIDRDIVYQPESILINPRSLTAESLAEVIGQAANTLEKAGPGAKLKASVMKGKTIIYIEKEGDVWINDPSVVTFRTEKPTDPSVITVKAETPEGDNVLQVQYKDRVDVWNNIIGEHFTLAIQEVTSGESGRIQAILVDRNNCAVLDVYGRTVPIDVYAPVKITMKSKKE